MTERCSSEELHGQGSDLMTEWADHFLSISAISASDHLLCRKHDAKAWLLCNLLDLPYSDVNRHRQAKRTGTDVNGSNGHWLHTIRIRGKKIIRVFNSKATVYQHSHIAESLSHRPINTHTPMNASDRASFDTFCFALQSFPRRLAERPELHGLLVGKKEMNITNGQQKGKAFMNTRRQNFWSVVHVGLLQLSGHMEAAGSNPADLVVVYRFQLRYADIPIEPIIEVTEPLASAALASPEIAARDLDVDVRRFNKRVADAVRAVLGGAGHGGIGGSTRAARRRGSMVWRPSLW